MKERVSSERLKILEQTSNWEMLEIVRDLLDARHERDDARKALLTLWNEWLHSEGQSVDEEAAFTLALYQIQVAVDAARAGESEK